MTTSTPAAHPDAWTPARLKFAAPLRNERMSASSDHADYLGLENIESWTGKIVKAEPKSSDLTDEDEGLANVFKEGDVLFGKLRPYLAKACHAPHDGVCSTELLVLRPVEYLHPRFLLYSMLTPDFVGAVDASTFGAKMPRASWDFIGSLEIRLPPIEAQSIIANYLDRETARIDGLIAEKERMLALLEEKRHSLVHKALEHPNTLMIRIQYAADAISRPIPRYDDGTYTPVGLFNRGRGIFHKEPSLGCDLGDSEFFFIQEGDLIVSGQFAWEGAVAVAKATEEGLVVSHRYHVLKGHEGVLNTTYLWAYLTTQWGDLVLNDNSRGAAGRNRPLNATSLLKEKIPVPPYELQGEIARHVAREELIKTVIDESKALLNEHRAALITAAVTGQISIDQMRS